MVEKEKGLALAKEEEEGLEKYKDFVVEIGHQEKQADGRFRTVVKKYMTVAGRLKMFWDNNIKEGKTGIINTQKAVDDENGVEFVAVVTGARGTATGTAREQKNNSVNVKSVVENCETSAIGRALGNLGYGLISSVAPAEDIKKAVGQEGKKTEKGFVITNPDAPVTDAQKDLIKKITTPISEPIVRMFLNKLEKENIDELTRGEAHEVIRQILSQEGEGVHGFAS